MSPRNHPPLLMNAGEAARLLGVSRPTLDRMIQAGTIGRVEISPGAFRLRRADVEALGGIAPGSAKDEGVTSA